MAYGTWVSPGSWGTMVNYWRYEWQRFRYLPVPNDRIKRTWRQKEKGFFMEISGSQQMVKDKNNILDLGGACYDLGIMSALRK